MDYETNGIRGIGRASEVVPRFGAYFRKHFMQLPQKELDSIAEIIFHTIISGYSAWLIITELSDGKILERKSLNSGSLFSEWIPTIYSNQMSDEMSIFFGKLSQIETIKYSNKFDYLKIAKSGIFW